MIKNYPLHARSFVKRMIRMRKRLIRDNLSKGDKSAMMRQVDHLEKLLDFYPYNTRKLMSRFIIRESSAILSIMPGQGSKSHDSASRQFQEIYDEALAIREETPKPTLV